MQFYINQRLSFEHKLQLCPILIQEYIFLPMFFDFCCHHPEMKLALSEGPGPQAL